MLHGDYNRCEKHDTEEHNVKPPFTQAPFMETLPTALCFYTQWTSSEIQIQWKPLPFRTLLCSFLAAGACTSIAKNWADFPRTAGPHIVCCLPAVIHLDETLVFWPNICPMCAGSRHTFGSCCSTSPRESDRSRLPWRPWWPRDSSQPSISRNS